MKPILTQKVTGKVMLRHGSIVIAQNPVEKDEKVMKSTKRDDDKYNRI